MKNVASNLRNQWMGALALFVALAGGTAWAATELEKNEVKSKHIGNGQVRNADLADDSITSPKVADGSLLDDDFAAGQLPAGPQGLQGVPGADGADGSPDTPQQVLDKAKQVDGDGSGLDADLLDAHSSAYFATSLAGQACPAGEAVVGFDLQGDIVCAAFAAPDRDHDGWPIDEDCDDTNPAVHTPSVEVDNGIDDDCDGTIDDGV